MTDDALNPICEAVAAAIAEAEGHRAEGQLAADDATGGDAKRADPAPVARAKPKAAKRGSGRRKAAPTEEGAQGPRQGDGEAYDVEAISRDYALVLMGSRAIVMKERAAGGPIDDRNRVLTVEAFLTWFSNRHEEIRAADGKWKTYTFGKIWLGDVHRRQFEGVEFWPDRDNQPGTPDYLNLWRGFGVKPALKPHGYKTFRDHLLVNVCQGDEKLFAWVFGLFADIVQRPRERTGVALVMRGAMGCGKTIVGEVFGALFPSHYFLVDDPRYVTGQFNAHMSSCLLLQADEAVWAGDKAAEGRLKGLLTSPFQQIEAKGVDPIRLRNYLRLVMTSNEGWVVPAGKDERRFAVLDVDPRCVGNHTYFAEITAELDSGGREALLHDLLHFDLDSIALRTIPKTQALLDQKERSLESVPSWWFGRLEAGCTTRHGDGWTRVVSTDALFNDYIETSDKIGVKRKAEESVFGKELRKVVTLRETRPTVAVPQSDGSIKKTRPRSCEFPSLKDCRAEWDEIIHQSKIWLPEDDESDHMPRESGTGSDF